MTTETIEGSGGEAGENRSIEALQVLAEMDDCDLVVADDYTLLLDLDGGEDAVGFFWSQISMLERNRAMPLNAGIDVWQSKSGENHHARIKLLAPMLLHERLLLQAVLGSDRVREALGYIRRVRAIENPIVLFKPRAV